MNKYKAKALKKYTWGTEKSCLLGISIGQGYHEGEKLEAVFAWACKRFDSFHIWIADTLHRHDMMFHYCESEEQAKIRSKLEGDAWLVRNATALEKITIPWSLSRWDQWLTDPRFAELQKQIVSLYETNMLFREAIHEDASRFLTSYTNRGNQLLDRDFAERKCIDFLIEENVGFPLMREDYPGVDLILGSELRSTTIISELLLPGAPKLCYERKYAKILFDKYSKKSQPEEPSYNIAANG